MDKITNPITGRKVSIYGKTGQTIINKYVANEQRGGDTTPHMGVRRGREGNSRITQAISDASRTRLGEDRSVAHRAASNHGHDELPARRPNVSAIALSVVEPVAANLRPRARGTRAERDEGIKKGERIGPVYPAVLNSAKMAEVLQANTQNKTKDQLTFLAGEGEPTQPEQDAFEEAIRHGDGSGFMDFPNLKLLFRGVLYDFLMRNGTITFQIEKSANVHSRCQTRGSRRLDGKIKYTYSKRGKLVLEKVMLERPTCWHKKLANEHPSARATL